MKADALEWTTVKNVGRKMSNNSGEHASYTQEDVSDYMDISVQPIHAREVSVFQMKCPIIKRMSSMDKIDQKEKSYTSFLQVTKKIIK